MKQQFHLQKLTFISGTDTLYFGTTDVRLVPGTCAAGDMPLTHAPSCMEGRGRREVEKATNVCMGGAVGWGRRQEDAREGAAEKWEIGKPDEPKFIPDWTVGRGGPWRLRSPWT